MTIELICVGTELLLGNIVNTNAAYLAEKFAGMGLSCYYQTVVGDNEERLRSVLKVAMERSAIVVLSGGLGPTEDDLTKETVAKIMGKPLVMDEDTKKWITRFFKARGLEATDNNWKQAMIPEGAMILHNLQGTAPGIILKENNTHVILLPGPPGELVPMFEEKVVPYIKELETSVILSKTIKICGVSESRVETNIKDLIDSQSNPTIATYAKTGEVHIRITAKAQDKKEARKLLQPISKEIKIRFGQEIYTTKEGVSLEMAIVDLLTIHKMDLACAESCTGGMLSARLINVPGVSEVYKVGYITYSNKAKRLILGVRKSTLRKYGAVSGETAKEMVRGAVRAGKTDVAIAITGIAGPEGGTKDKPVGLVCIACSVKGSVTLREYRFIGNRKKIRESATVAALVLMRQCLLGYFS